MLEIEGSKFDWLISSLSDEVALPEVCRTEFRAKLSPSAGWSALAGEIDTRLVAGEAVVVRGLGRDQRILPALTHAMGGTLHDPGGFGIVSTLQVTAFRPSVAETTGVIAFHTDFASDARPPDVVALQVDLADPKSPHFGRNQVASVERLLGLLDEIDPRIRRRLLEMRIPVGDFGNAFVGPALPDPAIATLLWPTPVLDRGRLDGSHYVDGMLIFDVVEEAAKAICEDVALEAGDILLADNRTALHRRSDCTVQLGGGKNAGRRINTLRWLR